MIVMDEIDAVLYINLAHRADRDAHIRHEILVKLGMPEHKVHRIDAVLRDPGALGCGLSHIKALNEALAHPEWNTVLILEDDFTFRMDSAEYNQSSIRNLFLMPKLDAGVLSYNHTYLRYENTNVSTIKKVLFSQTTSSYLIRRDYIPTLLQNMKEATYDMERNGKTEQNCIDIYWTNIQPHGNWYAVFPAIGYQYANYSDIEQRETSYGC
jgi:glycosyl transferase family 25